MIKNYLIRQAKESDLEEVVKVENDSFQPGRRAPIATFKKRLHLNPSGFLVIEIDNKIVAFSTGLITAEIHSIQDLNKPDERLQKNDGNSFYLRSLAVRNKYQKKGFGKLLFQKQMENAKNSGKKFFHFTAAKDVEGFYAKLGFPKTSPYFPFHNSHQALWKIKLF